MSFVLFGRRPAASAVARIGLIASLVVMGGGLSACTTVEGTNAMTDIGTFEREVMTSTLQGMGMVPREEKDEDVKPRGPLVLPKSTALPAPQAETKTAMLPTDSDTVQIDTSNLSEADLKRLRNARVVDLRTLDGRPLTEAEARALTARMQASNMGTLGQTKRPLYLPPEEYFVSYQGKDLICQAKNGQLVSLKDPSCPPEIRKALEKRLVNTNASNTGFIGSDPNRSLITQK